MLHAIILAVTKESAETIAHMVQQTGQIKIDCIFCPVESPHHFVLRLNGLSPEVVLIEMGDERNAMLCGLVREKAPEAAMLGFSVEDPAMVDPMWPNAPSQEHPVQPWPLTPADLLRTVRTAMAMKHPDPLPNVVAMMPSKAGVGASTTVLNVASQLAVSLGRKVLVVEADLRSGALKEAMNLNPSCSIVRTLARSDELATMMWTQQVVEADGVDLMPSRRETGVPLPQWYHYLRLLRFVSRRYELVLVDLPEVINDATAEVVRMARAVYVVATPELPSLQLARSRIGELHEVLEDADRVRIILNRWHRTDVHPRDIATALHRTVEAVLPNDYLSVKKAILANTYVDGKTRLGAAYRALAGFLVGATQAPQVEEPKSKLLAALVPAHVAINRRTA